MHRHCLLAFLTATCLSGCGQKNDSPNPQAPSSVPTTSMPPSNERSEPDTNLDFPALTNFVRFPSCGVEIPQPEGFEKADSFQGFGQPETQSSVMATRLAGPFSEIKSGFTEERMEERGWKLLSKQEVEVDGSSGILVHFEQVSLGDEYLKWSLIFGDEKATTMVTATFLKSLETELSARLKAVVLATRRDRAATGEPTADVPFQLAASSKLKPVAAMSSALAYSKEGVLPAKSPVDPLFIAAPSLGKVRVGDKREFAMKRLNATAHTKVQAVKSMDEITIAGMDGFEAVAEAEDEDSGAPLVVYQAIVFGEDSYILMVGLVGTELADEYLPEFKTMARSLQKKDR